MPAYGGQVPVCMRCGDRDIRQQSVGDGLWPAGGEGVAWVCDACGHIGAPLLVDPREVGQMEGRWATELSRTAGEVEDDDWAATSGLGAKRGPGSRGFAVAFVVLGTLFLVPGLLAVGQAILLAAPWALVRALVGTGWLSAIGLVLVVVGLRILSPAAPVPLEEPETSA